MGVDGRHTGWTIEDCVEEVEALGDDPEQQFYYTTYSAVYHTTPRCPHLQDSERLHVAGRLSNLNGPRVAGATRVVSAVDGGEDLDQCSWCEAHG